MIPSRFGSTTSIKVRRGILLADSTRRIIAAELLLGHSCSTWVATPQSHVNRMKHMLRSSSNFCAIDLESSEGRLWCLMAWALRQHVTLDNRNQPQWLDRWASGRSYRHLLDHMSIQFPQLVEPLSSLHLRSWFQAASPGQTGGSCDWELRRPQKKLKSLWTLYIYI